MKEIRCDFNTVTSEPLDLIKLGQLHIPLEDGELVWIYDEKMIVLARVQREGIFWLAEPEWHSMRPTPPELSATFH
jgi:hypothetical protein